MLAPEVMRALCLGVLALVSFLVCGIPFGLLISSKMANVDVRKTGSGNIGMTNVARSVGGKAAALTFLCDVGKGTLCMLLGRWALCAMGGVDPSLLAFGAPYDWMVAVLYLACVCGHIFSPYLHFKGGKGISVGFGAGLGLWWPVGLGLLGVFLLCAVPTRYVSLGSIVAAASLPVQCALWRLSLAGMVPVVLVAVVVIWSHRANIGRLVRHEERRFSLGHGKEGR